MLDLHPSKILIQDIVDLELNLKAAQAEGTMKQPAWLSNYSNFSI